MLHLDLSTTQGPSWKPGPVLFTTVFALFGGWAPTLWLFTARLGAVVAVVMAYRVAGRLGGRIAGVVAAVLVLTMHDFVRGAMYGEAEPLMVGALLFALDRAMAKSHRAALGLFVFAALLRPEVWLLLGAYALYLWFKVPGRRVSVLAALATVGLLWFGGDWWGSGDPLLGSERAKQFVAWNSYQHYAHPAQAMLNLANALLHRPAIAVALIAFLIAVIRRDRVVIVLGAAALSMLVAVVAMAQDGYPVLDRFLFGSVALTFVLTGVGVGFIFRLIKRKHVAIAAVAAVAVAAILSPLAITNARSWIPAAKSAQQWDEEVHTLPEAVAAVGGRRRILACRGSVATYVLMTPTLAWDLHVHMTRVFTWGEDPNGIIFIRDNDPLVTVEGQKPLRIRTIARVAGWDVLYVISRRPAPPAC